MEIGVDVGGTFTDLVAFDKATGLLHILKIPTTPQDQSRAFLAAVDAARNVNGAYHHIASVSHGSTVAINALIERKGCRVALVTTLGFRDVIELRRRDRPSPFGLQVRFEPLIAREHRFEVSLRVGVDGELVSRETDAEVAEVVKAAASESVDLLVVSLFNGFRRPQEEHRLAARLADAGWPKDRIVVATDISQEIREFERTGTAVANAYVKPTLARYLARVAASLNSASIETPLLVAQSNGGVAHWSATADRPISSLMSGPAAGVIAAAQMARLEGFEEAIACDIGGTSTDITVISGGRPQMRRAYDIEFGLPILLPMIDVRSIGAGGGSIARLDRGSVLQVGPQSAGSHPGPAAYGFGGLNATVTDAQISLGILPADSPLGTDGAISLSTEKAADAIMMNIGEPLGLAVDEAALAILSVAQQNISSAIKKLVTEKGRDPKEFALVSYGGGGASHTCALMRELGIRKAIIPFFAGATSALGCLLCDSRADLIRSVNIELSEEALEATRFIWQEQEQSAEDQHAATSGESISSQSETSLWCCYKGQAHSINVPVDAEQATVESVQHDFEAIYGERFGLTLEKFPVIITAVQTVSIASREKAFSLDAYMPPLASGGTLSPVSTRIMTTVAGTHSIPVFRRIDIPVGHILSGPAIIEQPDTTIVVEQGFEAELRRTGALIISISADRQTKP